MRVDEGLAVLHKVAVALLTVPLRLQRPLAFGDVTRNRRGARDLPGRILDRGYGQRDVDSPAVFPHANGFKMIDALSPLHLFENPYDLIGVVGRDQNRDRSADHLLLSIAIDPL